MPVETPMNVSPEQQIVNAGLQGMFEKLNQDFQSKFDDMMKREAEHQKTIIELQNRLLGQAGSPQLDRIYKVTLEEKFFRRVDKFSGEPGNSGHGFSILKLLWEQSILNFRECCIISWE